MFPPPALLPLFRPLIVPLFNFGCSDSGCFLIVRGFALIGRLSLAFADVVVIDANVCVVAVVTADVADADDVDIAAD